MHTYTHLVEQQYEASLQARGTAELRVDTGSQQQEQWLQHRTGLKQGLMGLANQHFKLLQQSCLALRV